MLPRNSQERSGAGALAPKLELRALAAGDEELLLRIFASTREEELVQLRGCFPEQIDAFLRSQLHAQKASYDERYPQASHQIILADGQEAGQLWVARCEEEIRLLDIALLPGFRSLGIGSRLLRELQQEAAATGKALRHCVFKPNVRAASFYQRLGFEPAADLGMYQLMQWNPNHGCDSLPAAKGSR
jgi:ribosomal protein S18 acetylase RimI-like enzyme